MAFSPDKDRLNRFAARVALAGLAYSTYSPGDGITRYRFFPAPKAGECAPDYFSGYSLGFTRGISNAEIWLDGYEAAQVEASRPTDVE
jgi:hypothetical protein